MRCQNNISLHKNDLRSNVIFIIIIMKHVTLFCHQLSILLRNIRHHIMFHIIALHTHCEFSITKQTITKLHMYSMT